MTFQILSASNRCRLYLRISCYFSSVKKKKLSAFFLLLMQRHGVYISPKAIISPSLKLPHPVAVVIGSGVTIEDNVTIYQCTTIGAKNTSDFASAKYPTIKAGTVIFAGSVVVGGVTIGKDCIIGANSLVLNDVPDGFVCAGSPAKLIKRNPHVHY